ncbi:MAG: hypothetical protein AAF735_02610 [Myxococcota bacterium]
MTQNRRWLGMVVISVALAAPVACGDENSDDDSDNGETFEAAFAVSQRIFTADGNRFLLVSVVPDLEAQELELGAGFEFAGTTRMRVFNERLFIFESERGEIIRYRVTPSLQLEQEGVLSLADLGVTRFSSTMLQVQPDRVYLSDFDNRLIVFDPQAMELVGTIPFAERTRDGFDQIRTSRMWQLGDELYLTIGWSNANTLEYVDRATVAVFSIPEQRLVRVVEDERCGHSRRAFVEDGALYTMGDGVDGVANVLVDDAPAPCLLRLPGGASAFDPDFYVDLTEASQRPFVTGGPIGFDNGRFLAQVYDSATDPDDLSLTGFAQGEI